MGGTPTTTRLRGHVQRHGQTSPRTARIVRMSAVFCSGEILVIWRHSASKGR